MVESQPADGTDTPPEPVTVWERGEQSVVWVSLHRPTEPRFRSQCPECENTRSIIVLDPPEKNPGEFHEVLQCRRCSSIWSPKALDTPVVRRAVVDLPAEGIEMPVEIQRVLIPYPHRDYICPHCDQPITTHQQRRLGRPAQHAHELNDVIRCPHCMRYFSPKVREATVIRS